MQRVKSPFGVVNRCGRTPCHRWRLLSLYISYVRPHETLFLVLRVSLAMTHYRCQRFRGFDFGRFILSQAFCRRRALQENVGRPLWAVVPLDHVDGFGPFRRRPFFLSLTYLKRAVFKSCLPPPSFFFVPDVRLFHTACAVVRFTAQHRPSSIKISRHLLQGIGCRPFFVVVRRRRPVSSIFLSCEVSCRPPPASSL